MEMVLARCSLFALIGATALLVGCGGGGGSDANGIRYSGITTPAAITAANAEEIGTAAAEGMSQSENGENAIDANPFGISIAGTSQASMSQEVKDAVQLAYRQLATNIMPTGVVFTSDDLNAQLVAAGVTAISFCGGSVNATGGALSGESSGTLAFNNLCLYIVALDQQTRINGSLQISETATSETTVYTNFSVTVDGETFTVNGTEVCETSAPWDCTMLTDYVGENGSTYRLAGVEITGDDNSGYQITATFYHPAYGSVDVITTTPITFGCASGAADAGTINFAGVGGTSGTVTFRSDCTGYDGTYNDGTSSGTFSGAWT